MKLAEIRKLKGMTQEQLATVSGVSRTSIARIELNTQNNVSIGLLFKLSNALGCSIGDLLGECDLKH